MVLTWGAKERVWQHGLASHGPMLECRICARLGRVARPFPLCPPPPPPPPCTGALDKRVWGRDYMHLHDVTRQHRCRPYYYVTAHVQVLKHTPLLCPLCYSIVHPLGHSLTGMMTGSDYSHTALHMHHHCTAMKAQKRTLLTGVPCTYMYVSFYV